MEEAQAAEREADEESQRGTRLSKLAEESRSRAAQLVGNAAMCAAAAAGADRELNQFNLIQNKLKARSHLAA